VVAVFCRRRRIPYVIEPIGMYPPIVRSLWKKRLFMRLVGRRLLEGAAAVVATSEFERAALLRSSLPAEKIVVRRNGLDMDELRPLPPRGRFRRALGVPAEAPLVLSLGRISRKKGLDLLVRAFATLPSSARLAIVGPDDGDGCAGELRRLAVEEGLTDRIVFRGAVEGGERLAAYADADVFVLPSRNENFGNVAAEAAVCGVPVVVTDRCGVAPLIENRAGIVVPCDEAAIGVAMRRLLGDDGLRERLRRGGFVLGDELSWVEPVKEMERLYERLSEPALALRRAQGERIFDGCTEASKRSG